MNPKQKLLAKLREKITPPESWKTCVKAYDTYDPKGDGESCGCCGFRPEQMLRELEQMLSKAIDTTIEAAQKSDLEAVPEKQEPSMEGISTATEVTAKEAEYNYNKGQNKARQSLIQAQEIFNKGE